MTVDALAQELGIAPSTLRNWLRKNYPRDPSEKGKPWVISDEIEAAARSKWPGEAPAAEPVAVLDEPPPPPPEVPAHSPPPSPAVEAETAAEGPLIEETEEEPVPPPPEAARNGAAPAEEVVLDEDEDDEEEPPPPPATPPRRRLRQREPLWLDSVGGDTEFRRPKLPARLKRSQAPRPRKQRLSVHAQYVLELVDDIVGEPGWRDHRFRWLTEDEPEEKWQSPGPLLPVDAYYPTRQLVVQYRDRRQHGDRRREALIPKQGIALVTVTPEILATDRRGRIAQRADDDAEAIEELIERAGAGARTDEDIKRERVESAVTRSWQLQVSALAMGLLVVGAFLLTSFRGDTQFLLNVGGALAAFGIAFDLYARVIGVLAARAHGETVWMWACGVVGSPAVFTHAALRRHGPTSPEIGSLAGLLGFTLVLALLLASLAGSIGG